MTIYFPQVRGFASLAIANLLFCAALTVTTDIPWSQANSAPFYGTVTDPSGAAVPQANVTLVEQGTQAITTKTTSSDGEFAFNFIPVGSYTLKIDAAGFKSYVSTGLSLMAGQ